ncbi:MAG: glucose-1-phosphate adenylyltransferase [Anaerolineaceae bacterium]|nr:glucose-1-phosphate adenylyltransferase [Anaerolineaceae bacterium]
MKTRAVILAGGEGTRLGVLTAKRTKPAVTFAGKYRIIDFTLSNCVNSNIFDVMIIAQYRPHSLIEHLGAGGPWDLNRDFTGGIRIYTPYKAPTSGWFNGTADAVQQNFSFIKHNNPETVLILSGDHVYTMDYEAMLRFHMEKEADLTIATIQVTREDASRFGIMQIDDEQRITSFDEKPKYPDGTNANMGVYLFNTNILNDALWEDHLDENSSHDFGKDILPKLIESKFNIYAYPYNGYWVDVGTINSYWQAQMDLLNHPPALNLHDRSWIIHTRTEERPPAYIENNAEVSNSLISDGCIIEDGAKVIHSILSPGVRVKSNAVIRDAIILTDGVINQGAIVERAILDKKVIVSEKARVGSMIKNKLLISMVGKGSVIPDGATIEAGAMIGTDVNPFDFATNIIQSGELLETKRQPNEL